MAIEGMHDTLAQSLFQFGYTVEGLLTADSSQLTGVPGMTEDKAKEIKENAKKLIESGKLSEMRMKQQEAAKAAQAAPRTSTDAVFEKLKAEVKAHQQRERQGEEGEKVAAEAASNTGTTE